MSAVPAPDTLEDLLTPAWLAAALSERFPGVVIDEVVPGPVVSRVSTNARFRIAAAGGLPEGLSPHLCAKGYFNEVGRRFRQAGEIEARFYRDIAELAGIETLRALYADVDSAVVVTEDLVPQGATFLDGRSLYGVERTAASLTQLAKLHAATWMHPKLADAPWLGSRLHLYPERRGVEDISVNFDGPIGAGAPAEVRDAPRLLAAYRSLAALVPSLSPWSVIHGDPHVGNVYLDGAGRPCFMDWQLVQRSPWYLDVGYHLASALEPEDRRANEDDLLRHYLDELGSAGIEPPSPDEVRLGYRRGILHGYFLWAITLKVDPDVTASLLTRLGTAAADHDALASVP